MTFENSFQLRKQSNLLSVVFAVVETDGVGDDVTSCDIMAAAKSAATIELVPDDELEFEAKGVLLEDPIPPLAEDDVSMDKGLGATPCAMFCRILGGSEDAGVFCEKRAPLRNCERLGMSAGVARISATLGSSAPLRDGVFIEAAGVKPRPPVSAVWLSLRNWFIRGKSRGVSMADARLGDTAKMVDMGCELSKGCLFVAAAVDDACCCEVNCSSRAGAFGTISGIGLKGVSNSLRSCG